MSTWYGQNRSGRTTPWPKGSILRYGDGSTALFRVDSIYENPDPRGIACSVRYYGEHIFGGSHGAYHGQCVEPTAADFERWLKERGALPTGEETATVVTLPELPTIQQWLRSAAFHTILGQYMKDREADQLQLDILRAFVAQFPPKGD